MSHINMNTRVTFQAEPTSPATNHAPSAKQPKEAHSRKCTPNGNRPQ